MAGWYDWLNSVKPGDKVTVMAGGFYRCIRKIGVVEKVSSTRITLKDGSVWNARDGRMWGSGLGWATSDSIRAFEEDDTKKLLKQQCVDRLKSMDRKWDQLDVDTLEAIVKLLPQEGT